jgi:signal transduction histidine kinase
MANSPKISESDGSVDLESVISTAQLRKRPYRAPRYHEESKALIELAREMVASPDSILQKLADTALTLCHAGSSGISLLEPEGARFYWPAVTGALAPHLGEGTPRNFGPCGTVLDRNAPQLMSRPERHFRYLESITPPIEEVLLIPFYINRRPVGTIWVIAHDRERGFDAEDLRVMTNLAAFAAAAYQVLTTHANLRHEDVRERARAEGKVVELSGRLLNIQDEERRRIARDLHDTTGQLLAALTINLSGMQRDASPENSSKFVECIDLVAAATAEIRSLAYVLHPPLMDVLGLSSAVKDYAEGLQKRSGLQIAVDISDEIGRFEEDREIALFRIIQECLGNIHRHSGSATAAVRIFRLGDKIITEVSDQGRGFDATNNTGRGIGLRSMEERLRSVGGKLTIKSDSTGTTVKAVLPVS